MTSEHRENILQKLGFSQKDMDWGIKAANIARRKQRKTRANLHASDIHEKLETLRKNVKNGLTLGRNKKKEPEYLDRHVPSYNKTNMAEISEQTEKTLDDCSESSNVLIRWL